MKFDVAIIGCGFVGLTLAAAFNRAGLKVIGIEPRAEIRDKIKTGIAPFREPGLAEAMEGITACERLSPEHETDAYVICVGTPLEPDGKLEEAVVAVAQHMKGGELIVIRSTVRVGTTRRVVKPILDATGKEFDLAYCPERTVEGNALEELRTLTQIIGCDEQESGIRSIHLFMKLGCRTFSCRWETAETAKLLANAWRDVTFAFANEVARICSVNGVSASAAIEAANWRYPRCQIPRPGPVGGPCLTKDSLLFVQGVPEQLIRTARWRNESLPTEIAAKVGMRVFDRLAGPGKIAVLGTAFKGDPETDDTRDSPGLEIASALKEWGHDVTTIDPVACADKKAADLLDLYDTYDAIVVTTNHPAWAGMALTASLKADGFVYDCCGTLPPEPSVMRFGG